MYYSLLAALIFLYSRGLFEIFFSKQLSYVLEFSLFALFLFLFLFRRINPRFLKRDLILAALIFISSFISIILSNIRVNDAIYSLYIAYFIYVIALYIFFSSMQLLLINIEKLLLTLSIVIYILVGVAYLEQFGIINMPGHSFYLTFIRPSSLTGSYLHYPLILTCLGITVHALKKKLTFPSLVAYISVFSAFSRSGMFIIVLTFLIIFLVKSSSVWNKYFLFKKKYVFRFFYTIVILCCIIYFIQNFIDVKYIIERFVSSVNTNAEGNVGRLEAWKYAIEKFSETNILFGEYFGQVTNFTKNLLSRKSIIVESGLLQLFLDIGLMGTISFYLLFINLILRSKSLIFKAFLIAFICESFVYQSIEVLPFITSIFFFSIFFKSLYVRGN